MKTEEVIATDLRVGDICVTRSDFGGFPFGPETTHRLTHVEHVIGVWKGEPFVEEVRVTFDNGDSTSVDDGEEITRVVEP